MNIYILEVSELTYNYHSGGGLVIIAESIEDAKNVISVDKNIKPDEQEWASAQIFRVISKEKQYWVFPDAGCC